MTGTEQERRLARVLWSCSAIRHVLEATPTLGLPDWYLVAGCIAGAVWNDAHGDEPEAHIKDLDLVYFDDSDISYEAEDAVIQRAGRVFADSPIPVEVRNQARVHVWYPDHFGTTIEPFRDSTDAISTYPTTATSVGVRRDHAGTLRVCAPFGLDDLFDLIVRPNRVQVTREVYEEKARRWSEAWPMVRVTPW